MSHTETMSGTEPMDNPSFLMRKINETAFEDRSVPDVFDDEILVAVKKTGICGSDVHFLCEGRIAHLVVEKPMVLGHESSGVVTKVGQKVKALKPGDRVALEPGATCRICHQCRSGVYQLCQNIAFAATPPTDGTLARYYRLPADIAYKIPDSMTLEDGAMIEPLAVGIHAIANLGQFRSGQTIAIFGCGPVGLLMLAAARALGATRAIAIDIVPSRLAFAKEYAATDVWTPIKRQEEGNESEMEYAKRNAEGMKREFGFADVGPGAIDLVVDASGAKASIQTGIMIARAGGTYVQVGMGNPEVEIPITTVLTKELKMKGSFRYGSGDYKLAISLVAAGKIDLKPLVTHRYKFEDADKAFDTTKKGVGEDGKASIKVIISGPGVSLDEKM